MSSADTQADRNRAVAEVAAKLLGPPIIEYDVIGQTLARVTDPLQDVVSIAAELPAAVQREQFDWQDSAAFQRDPLSIWVALYGKSATTSLPASGGAPATMR